MNQALVIPAGTKDLLPPDIEYPVYEVRNDAPSIMNEVAKLPWHDVELLPVIPGEAHKDEVKRWRTAIGDSVTALKVSAYSNDRLAYMRLHNAFENLEQFKASVPVQCHTKGPLDTAFIIGSGPSLNRFIETYGQKVNLKGATYACWHAAHRFEYLSFVGHCDPRTPSGADFSREPAKCYGVIATPGCSPDFLNDYKADRLYGYFSDDSPIDAWFVGKFQATAAPSINGTVTHMLTKAALLHGYKRIVLVGCELGYNSRKDAEQKHPGIQIHKSRSHSGKTVYSPTNYFTCRWGFDVLHKEHPDVAFINYSKDGVHFEGFEYE